MRKLRVELIGALVVVAATALLWRAWQLHSTRRAAVREELIDAIQGEDVARVKGLLDEGAPVNYTGGEWDWTPLHVAASRGYSDIAKLLIERGADVNATEKGRSGGDTPLHVAAARGRVQVAELLIDSGADVNANTVYVGTPLSSAIHAEARDVAELLVARGADVNLKGTGSGNPPLHWAVFRDRADLAEWLLDNGADIDAVNVFGDTALNQAASHGQLELAQLLVSRGARVNFHDAAALGDVERIKRFIAAGEDPDAPDGRGHRPLHYAVSGGHMAAAKALIDAGASLDVEPRSRRSPLHVAAGLGDEQMVRFLLEAGADVNVRATGRMSGPTALDVALAERQNEVAAILREHGGKTWRELRSEESK